MSDIPARTEHRRQSANRFSRPARDATAPPQQVRRATAASALGNATEWYDYGVYAVATAYISQHFFDPFDNAMLLTLATFAISFLVRPLGGFVWGPIGDRLGRKAILAMTILLMSGATFLIGVLPTYEAIGLWAPILLILLRMVQGFSTGGEYGGAATYMAEYAPSSKRGFFGSFLEFGTMGGYALGTVIMLSLELLLTPEQMTQWGWRLPFLLALPLGAIGFYLRSRLNDTPVYNELQDETDAAAGAEAAAATETGSASGAKPGYRTLFRDHWRSILVMAGLVVSLNIVNYTLLTFMPTYLQQQLGLESSTGLTIILVGQLVMMVFMPVFGSLSDRIGRKRSWYISTIGLAVVAVPMFQLIGVNLGLAILGFAVLAFLFIPQISTITATFPAMFPTQVRFAGFAITYNVATSVFGGTAAMVNGIGVEQTGDLLFPAYYMIAACVIGLVAAWFMPETAGASLHGTQVPGAVGSAVEPGSPAETALESGQQPQQRAMSEREMQEVTEQDLDSARS